MKNLWTALRATALLLAFAAVVRAAEPVVVDSFTTLDGKETYTRAKLMRIDGDSVYFSHSAGATRVPIDQLPDNARVAFGMRTRADEKVYAA